MLYSFILHSAFFMTLPELEFLTRTMACEKELSFVSSYKPIPDYFLITMNSFGARRGPVDFSFVEEHGIVDAYRLIFTYRTTTFARYIEP